MREAGLPLGWYEVLLHIYAHITAAGEAGFARAHAVFLRSLDRTLGSHLDPAEVDAMNAALSRLS